MHWTPLPNLNRLSQVALLFAIVRFHFEWKATLLVGCQISKQVAGGSFKGLLPVPCQTARTAFVRAGVFWAPSRASLLCHSSEDFPPKAYSSPLLGLVACASRLEGGMQRPPVQQTLIGQCLLLLVVCVWTPFPARTTTTSTPKDFARQSWEMSSKAVICSSFAHDHRFPSTWLYCLNDHLSVVWLDVHFLANPWTNELLFKRMTNTELSLFIINFN